MSVNFDKIIKVDTPKGRVTKIEKLNGQVLWHAPWTAGTFKVRQITSKTYANSTDYENETFILLDVYPKPGGTVTVTYEGTTLIGEKVVIQKTVADPGGDTTTTNSGMPVWFGTFNGERYPAEGEIPSEGIIYVTGDCRGIGCGAYNKSKMMGAAVAQCITAVGDLSQMEYIPTQAFAGCGAITEVLIPKSVKTIGSMAFTNCSSLRKVVLNNSVTTIDNSAFYACVALKNIFIPNSVTSLGTSAFAGCKALDNIYVGSSNPVYHSAGNCLITTTDKILHTGCNKSIIPTDGSVTAIGSAAFSHKKFSTIKIPNSITSIGSSAFTNCTSLSSIDLPDSVTSIGDSAFYQCSSLKNVTLSKSITSIGSKAFYSCSALTDLEIPDSVTSIGSEAFVGLSNFNYNSYDNAEYIGNTNNPYIYLARAKNTTSLTSCTISDRTRFISEKAFSSCDNLTNVILPATPPGLSGGSSSFSSSASITFYVPTINDIATYEAHSQWSSFKGKFKALSPVYVTFNCGTMGQGTMSKQSFNGGYQNLNSVTFTPKQTGYRFTGWNTAADGSGASYGNCASVTFANDITLYAQWSNMYRLTYTHSNKTGWSSNNDETGHKECYALYINGELQPKFDKFNEGNSRGYSLPYGTQLLVYVSDYAPNDHYDSGNVTIYLKENNNERAVSAGWKAASYSFTLTKDTIIDFQWYIAGSWATFNARSYEDCHITTY